jgi:F0F1-type ATP synthase alpha subunit
MPATLDRLIKGVKNVDTIIGGHLPNQQWKDLEEYQRFNADLLTATREALKAGKTVDEAVTALNLMSKYPGYESMRVKAAVQAIYEELGKK